MMKCLPILLLLVILGSGCQKNNGDQAAKETEAKPLTPIPAEVTLEFVRELWSQPHDEAGVIDQIKQYMQPGKWRNLRTFAPKGATHSTNELSRELSREVKYVDRRFLVFQSRFEKLIDEGAISLEGAEIMGVITYDFKEKVLKYWEFATGEGNEGLELYMIGEPDITFKHITWKSLKMPNSPPGWRMEFIQDIDDAREKLVAEGSMINGEETMVLIQDEMTLLKAPGPGS
jgi:hypothetical protein